MTKMSSLTNETIRVRNLVGSANDHMSSARTHLDLGVWYSREGIQMVGTRADYDAFIASGE